MEAIARARYLRIAPKKMQIVADEVRGKPVAAALQLLQFSNQKAARLVAKVLKAAVASAEENEQMGDVDDLTISKIQVDGGPALRRFMARAMGRAYRIKKRTSHLMVVVSDGSDQG